LIHDFLFEFIIARTVKEAAYIGVLLDVTGLSKVG
jgi:hypothetical protein